MINLNSSEIDVLRTLLEREVRFLVVGGRAVNFHGHLRPAPDLDLFYSDTDDNKARLLEALKPFGGNNLTFDSLAAIIQVNIYGNPIQLHSEIDAISFDDASSQIVFAKCANLKLPFISCNHLLQNKRASGHKPDRKKDLDDVAALESLCKTPSPY